MEISSSDENRGRYPQRNRFFQILPWLELQQAFQPTNKFPHNYALWSVWSLCCFLSHSPHYFLVLGYVTGNFAHRLIPSKFLYRPVSIQHTSHTTHQALAEKSSRAHSNVTASYFLPVTQITDAQLPNFRIHHCWQSERFLRKNITCVPLTTIFKDM